MVETTQTAGLRSEFVDGAVKAVALMSYKLKTLCAVDSTSAWTNTYYREDNSELVGGGEASPTNVKGIPRLAPFPYGEVSWTRVEGIIQKYGMEGMLSYEDIQMNDIPMIERTLTRIGRAVSFSVDSQIASQMSTDFGNTYAISAGNEWDSATVANRDPVFDILKGIQTLRADNIDALAGNGYLCLNGTDYTNLISNTKIVNSPTYKSADVITNGVVGEIAGLKIMVTEALEADTPDVAYIVIAKEAMTWKQSTPLTVVQDEVAGIKTTIRAFELGQLQVVAPNAICKITNTRA